MKPHPRIRKTIKWGGAAVTVLLVVAWIGSGWLYLDRTGGRSKWALQNGCLQCLHYSKEFAGSGIEANWSAMVMPEGFRHRQWWFSRYDYVDYMEYEIPLWALAAPVLAATIAAWRVDTLVRRRARLNLCPKCNYDRAGIAAGARCPECGCGGDGAGLM